MIRGLPHKTERKSEMILRWAGVITLAYSISTYFCKSENRRGYFDCETDSDCRGGLLCVDNKCHIFGDSDHFTYNISTYSVDSERDDVTTVQDVLSLIAAIKCSEDDSCPINYYCFKTSCIRCFDCAILYRQPRSGNCAKLKSDCSVCLDGFVEVPVTTDVNTKPCEKKPDTSNEFYVKTASSNDYNGEIYIIIAGVVVIIIIAVICCLRKGTRWYIGQDYGNSGLDNENSGLV